MADQAPGGRDFARIRARNPGPMTLTGTNTYVVGRDPALVIDPGPDDPAHIEALRAEGEARGGIAGVLLTHAHADHTAGVDGLGAPVLWGAPGAGDETSGPWLPDPDADPARDLPPGFTALATPGHAIDHHCFAWGDTVFCGDLILGEGSTIVPPRAFGGSLRDYLASLDVVEAAEPALLAPGHGEWILDPRERIAGYRRHRLDRQRRLVAALDEGERSRERLLDRVWSDVPPELRLAAAAAMQAHLELLEDEGHTIELT